MSIGLESTSDRALSVSFFQLVVELTLSNAQLLQSVWFASIVWVKVGLSECRAPLFIKSWVWSEESLFTVASEEGWSGAVEISLVSHEVSADESLMSSLEAIFFEEASSGYL